ncbi:MAG: glycosyltransferase [Candidatus Hydrogenedentota bacterium]
MTNEQAWWILNSFNYAVLAYFFLLNTTYLATSIFAFVGLRRYSRRLKALDIESLITSTGAPAITVIAPAFNEELTCVTTVKSLLELRYPDYEIMIVNDGSTDEMLPRLKAAFELVRVPRADTANIPTMQIRGIYRSERYENLWVVDKENGGKADSLNAGINFCRTSLFCSMDADCLLERDALTRIVRPFLENSDTIAAGGLIRIANDSVIAGGRVAEVRFPRKWLVGFQVLEYLRAFFSGRMGWDVLGVTLVISGAFGLYKRSVVVDAGGYSTSTVGEDMELVVRLHRHCRTNDIPYEIGFVADPIAWTQAPETIRGLARQRDRWQRGLMESLSNHRGILFNPKFGKIGFLGFPYFYFLEMMGPVIEFGGYITFLAVVFLATPPVIYVLAFLAVSIVYGIVLSVSSVALEELSYRRYPKSGDLVRLLLFSIFENFGYRQMITVFRFKGVISSLFRVTEWGKADRTGFDGVCQRENDRKRVARSMKMKISEAAR